MFDSGTTSDVCIKSARELSHWAFISTHLPQRINEIDSRENLLNSITMVESQAESRISFEKMV